MKEYLEALQQIHILSFEEESALWEKWQQEGDDASRKLLIESYQPLVFKTAMSFQVSTELKMDLIQEGTVGLIEAAERFDVKRGVAFSLFAVHRIRGRMLNYLEKEGRQTVASIDLPWLEADGATLAEQLLDAGPAVATQVEQRYLVGQVQQALGRLPAKEQQVVSGIFLRDCEAKELAEELNVTLSHVYRLQKQGVRRIRGMLSRFMQHW